MIKKFAAILSSALLIGLMGTPLGNRAIAPSITAQPQGISPADGQPLMCLGNEELTRRWGGNSGNCPDDYAFFGVDDPAGPQGPAEHIRVSGACCPLPAEDILTSEHLYSSVSCLDGWVATGSRTTGSGPSSVTEMRCTKVNSERYQLGIAQNSLYWGNGAAGWKLARRIAWDDIPPGIRYSQGRTGSKNWDVDGCIGYPWGSLLSEKHSKHCSGFRFRELQYSGRVGDPVAGTPVLMFPVCREAQQPDPRTGLPQVQCG